MIQGPAAWLRGEGEDNGRVSEPPRTAGDRAVPGAPSDRVVHALGSSLDKSPRPHLAAIPQSHEGLSVGYKLPRALPF